VLINTTTLAACVAKAARWSASPSAARTPASEAAPLGPAGISELVQLPHCGSDRGDAAAIEPGHDGGCGVLQRGLQGRSDPRRHGDEIRHTLDLSALIGDGLQRFLGRSLGNVAPSSQAEELSHSGHRTTVIAIRRGDEGDARLDDAFA
jgi:hypothetical protein